MNVLKAIRSEADHDRLDDEVAAIIKGMLLRGDKHSDIAACFMINGGRVSEINTGARFAEIKPTPPSALPPPGPYPSPFDLWKAKNDVWRSRVALEAAHDAIRKALLAVHKAEQR